MQTKDMPCATFRTLPFQYSSLHSFENSLIRTFRALVSSQAQYCQVLQYKVAALNESAQLNEIDAAVEAAAADGIQPVTMCNPPTVSNACSYGVKGLSVVQGAVPCQLQWHQVRAIRGGVWQLCTSAEWANSCIQPILWIQA
jgi:hypothetical protein